MHKGACQGVIYNSENFEITLNVYCEGKVT